MLKSVTWKELLVVRAESEEEFKIIYLKIYDKIYLLMKLARFS